MKNDSRDASSRSLMRKTPSAGDAVGVALEAEEELRADTSTNVSAFSIPASNVPPLRPLALIEADQPVELRRR